MYCVSAPETLTGKGYKGEPVDVFSAGVILFHMVVGNIPFKTNKSTCMYYQAFSEGKYDAFWASILR